MWGRVGRIGRVVLIPSILMRFIDNKFTDKDIPENFKEYFPVNFKISKNIEKALREKIKSSNLKDANDGRRKYIGLARSIETFGCEIYNCYYYETVKQKKVKKECLFYVTPYRIYAVDIQTKKANLFHTKKKYL